MLYMRRRTQFGGGEPEAQNGAIERVRVDHGLLVLLPLARLRRVDSRHEIGHSQYCGAPDSAGLFSEGGEVIKLHTEGSLMIPRTGVKRV